MVLTWNLIEMALLNVCFVGHTNRCSTIWHFCMTKNPACKIRLKTNTPNIYEKSFFYYQKRSGDMFNSRRGTFLLVYFTSDYFMHTNLQRSEQYVDHRHFSQSVNHEFLYHCVQNRHCMRNI